MNAKLIKFAEIYVNPLNICFVQLNHNEVWLYTTENTSAYIAKFDNEQAAKIALADLVDAVNGVTK